MSEFRMNSARGKAILALVRDGDHAHPGEEEAIALVARRIDRSSLRRLLDVGCGRGGSAAWFQQRGWGEVSGVDVDAASIEYARQRFPAVRFLYSDVADLPKRGIGRFDLVYLLTAYYAFPDQLSALHAMRAVCRLGGQLLLFDYSRRDGSPPPRELGPEIGRPLRLDTIGGNLAEAGWRLDGIEDWSDRFVGWYASLLRRFAERRTTIIRDSGTDWYDYVVTWYSALHRALAEGRLGGALLSATAVAAD